MTVDQQIQIWNVIGTWLAGIATFAAVVVSLRLARSADKIRLRAHAGLRVVVSGDGSPTEEHLEIQVTNIASRPVTVASVGWAVGKRKNKRFCLQTVSGQYTHQYPIELPHGKSARFLVSFVQTPQWLAEFANGFVKSGEERYLNTLVAQVHTSVGQTIELKPEPELLGRLRAAYKNG
jgi:hypothetical protein